MNLDPIILAELQRGGPPLWVKDRMYRAGQCVRSPGDWLKYVRKTDGAGAADPKDDGDNYVRWSKALEAAIAVVGAAVLGVGAAVDGVAGTVNAINTTVNSINAAKGIKSVQRGVATPAANSGGVVVVTIAPVVPNKTMVNLPAVRGYYGNVGATVEMQLRLLSSTELQVTSAVYGSAGTATSQPCGWEVIEWH